jgi:hypothetical protein
VARFGSCSSGNPIHACKPSGTATSSAKKVPSDLPVIRRHELADQVAEGDAVVDVLGSRLPLWLLRLECPDHRIPGARLFEGKWPIDARQAGLVRKQPAHRDVFLTRRAELGPVRDHRRVEIQLAALHQHVGADRAGTLRRRRHSRDRVLLPRPTRLTVRETTPHIDDRTPVHIDTARCTSLARAPACPLLEVTLEGICHLPPTVLNMPLHHNLTCLTHSAAHPFETISDTSRPRSQRLATVRRKLT